MNEGSIRIDSICVGQHFFVRKCSLLSGEWVVVHVASRPACELSIFIRL